MRLEGAVDIRALLTPICGGRGLGCTSDAGVHENRRFVVKASIATHGWGLELSARAGCRGEGWDTTSK